jgi:hypothetical protein
LSGALLKRWADKPKYFSQAGFPSAVRIAAKTRIWIPFVRQRITRSPEKLLVHDTDSQKMHAKNACFI